MSTIPDLTNTSSWPDEDLIALYWACLAPSVAGPAAYPIGWKRAGASVIDPATVPEWAIGVSYKVGDKATYQGVAYSCVQAHSAQAGWDPPHVPALWTAA